MTTLDNFEVHTTSEVGSTAEKNVVRMRRFWSDEKNAVLYSIGKLLQPIAQKMIAREEFTLPEAIKVSGKNVPLAPGQVLSLSNVSTWGCPACQSAHGTGSKSSPNPNAGYLAQNQFYYNPVTQRVFAISATCFKQYVRDLKQTGRIRNIADFNATPAVVVASKPTPPTAKK